MNDFVVRVCIRADVNDAIHPFDDSYMADRYLEVTDSPRIHCQKLVNAAVTIKNDNQYY